MKKLFVFVVLLCTLAFAQKVACVGNSLTQTAYPAYLNAKTTATVKRFGVPGATMLKAHPNAYWNTTTFVDVQNWNPEYTIILLGTNDTGVWNSTNAILYGNDYRDFLTHFNGHIYLGIIPYLMPKDAKIERNQDIDEANAIVRQIAADYGLKTIDFQSALGPEHYISDGVHMNDAGQEVMAQTAYDVIRTDLPAEPVCVDTNWQPDPSTIPIGQQFTQTSNCGNTRTATGTKPNTVLEDMTLTLFYNEQTKSLELSWTDIPETGTYRLNKAWPDIANKLILSWWIFENNEHSHIDTNIVALRTYYYGVEAFKDGYWSHKSRTIEFIAPEYLSIEDEEYWKAVEDYENQRIGLFNGCSRKQQK